MKKLIVLIYIAAAAFLFGYARAGALHHPAFAAGIAADHIPSIDFPGSFEDLTVKLADNRAVISWSTLTEKNNKQFEIQRSTDGEAFKTIAIIFTLSDSSEVKSYTFRDELKGVKGKKIIYRIKQVDTSEHYTFSKTASPA